MEFWNERYKEFKEFAKQHGVDVTEKQFEETCKKPKQKERAE